MDHHDHVRLIREGVEGAGMIWADLGSGAGAFTLALADLLGPAGVIHSVDRDSGALRTQAASLHRSFPGTILHQYIADFTHSIGLPALDGVVMANSLHFVRDKLPVLDLARRSMRPGGHFVLVEYEADQGNPWVPYPLSFRTWRALATAAGFEDTKAMARVPSRFLGAIYSALSLVPVDAPGS
jgi:ubiquinone/menaquinone biosynthesis C-methylase UbiE